MTGKNTSQGDCQAVEPLLSSFAAGALDEPAERRVRDHLAACRACREEQMARDPTALFYELRRVPLPDGFLDDLAVNVRRRIESRSSLWARLVDRAAGRGPRRLAYVLAPVMTLLLLGTLFLVRPGRPWRQGFRAHGQGGIVSPYAVPPGSPAPDRSGRTAPRLPAGPATGAATAPPLMEEVQSGSARVYRFTVESGGDETPIYFIVDEKIDI
ncbi:MAG TPA: zf-HC2 domain-containing protein [Candidatus Polarisedimenticolia bacterium]|nr:zf-HC2 domain-containing protein [Candidatus Polarisedimenticolia bacterium]